jgi:hypothetical protein
MTDPNSELFTKLLIEVRDEVKELRTELRDELQEVRSNMKEMRIEVRNEMNDLRRAVDTKMARGEFLAWLGGTATVVALVAYNLHP